MNNTKLMSLAPSAQRGAALITSLVILLVLTAIGITALSTTSLEQKMATNLQDFNRAFQAAETGLKHALDNPGSVSLTSTIDGSTGALGYYEATAATSTKLLGWSDPPRRTSGVYSRSRFSAAHFETTSTGKAKADTSGAVVVLHEGMYQITPKLE
jgi:type IV pilus assembly protein PilX